MSQHSKKNKTQNNRRWVLTVFCLTVLISAAFSLISSVLLENASMLLSLLILLLIILIGIGFDMIGVAVTAADEAPFHAMASHKAPAAQEAIWLLRNANKVSSFCNDVIGDICGVISGSAAAVIAAKALVLAQNSNHTVLSLVFSALVAALTVSGKAAGKTYALAAPTKVVLFSAKILYFFNTFGKKGSKFRGKK